MATLKRKRTDQSATMRYLNGAAADLADGDEVRVLTNGAGDQCVAGVVVGTIAAGDTGVIDIANEYSYPCDAATVFAAGDQVYEDEDTGLAVVGQAGLGAGNAGYCVGTCARARAATDPAVVEVILNFGPEAGTRVP